LQGVFFFPARDARTVCGQDTRDICTTTHQAKRKKNMSKKDAVQC
jgi:hypothetical protein